MKAHSCPIKGIQASLKRLSCILSSSQAQVAPILGKKTESDLDYNPDNDEDTQDTEEDYGWKKQQSLSSKKKVKYDLHKLYYALL